LPPLRLKVVSAGCNMNGIVCEFFDKIHNNLEEEHSK
jgi:hypothetical protein